MEFDQPPSLPSGFTCAGRNCGIKPDAPDLALFASDRPAAAAAIFTRNHFPGAPVIVGRERIRSGRLQGVVVNSKVSNVGTGPAGEETARAMARAAAEEMGISEELVLMSSTGVIGVPLPLEKVQRGLRGMSADLSDDPWPAARAIMTTDTEPKVVSCSVGETTLTAVGKGAGMVAPNMATMLVFLFTDAQLGAAALSEHLRIAANRSFHCLSVDSDTSTSDTVAILANGRAGPVDSAAFQVALDAVCVRMAEWVARDGEGATKLLRVRVTEAESDGDARRIARAVVDSPLIKTMAYGADPNVGRLLMAIGKCVDCRVEPERTAAIVQGVQVIRGGLRAEFDDEEVRRLLQSDPIEIEISLGVGGGEALGLGCDLTEGYIHENAAYHSS